MHIVKETEAEEKKETLRNCCMKLRITVVVPPLYYKKKGKQKNTPHVYHRFFFFPFSLKKKKSFLPLYPTSFFFGLLTWSSVSRHYIITILHSVLWKSSLGMMCDTKRSR